MKFLFKNTYVFSALFFLVLAADIFIKTKFDFHSLRFLTKGILISMLLVYYLVNQREVSYKKRVFMILALVFFVLGDALLVLYEITALYILGMLCFIMGKLFYIFRFSNQSVFSLRRLLPFLVLCFVYMFVLLSLTYNRLEGYFYPVLLYLFMAMTVMLFAILRKMEVSKKSYYIVMLGIVFSIFSDSIAILQSFYDENIAYHMVTIMLFYGLSQYFIVFGIVEETNPNPALKDIR